MCHRLKPNSVEPPWYGPVCPVVWEGWRREASPYPDQSVAGSHGEFSVKEIIVRKSGLDLSGVSESVEMSAFAVGGENGERGT